MRHEALYLPEARAAGAAGLEEAAAINPGLAPSSGPTKARRPLTAVFAA